MSVASRILSILRSQALPTARALLERARGHRPFSQHGTPPASDEPPSDQPASDQPFSDEPPSDKPPSNRGFDQDPDLATYYANLEIPYGTGREDVEAAWKRQVRRYHPDRHASNPERHAVATELLQGINHAYTELCRHLESSKPS
jgi:hypothetical protein